MEQFDDVMTLLVFCYLLLLCCAIYLIHSFVERALGTVTGIYCFGPLPCWQPRVGGKGDTGGGKLGIRSTTVRNRSHLFHLCGI
ncbi:hypothetical protein BJX76DRAFT_216156 [Aspergillus varians]